MKWKNRVTNHKSFPLRFWCQRKALILGHARFVFFRDSSVVLSWTLVQIFIPRGQISSVCWAADYGSSFTSSFAFLVQGQVSPQVPNGSPWNLVQTLYVHFHVHPTGWTIIDWWWFPGLCPCTIFYSVQYLSPTLTKVFKKTKHLIVL